MVEGCGLGLGAFLGIAPSWGYSIGMILSEGKQLALSVTYADSRAVSSSL